MKKDDNRLCSSRQRFENFITELKLKRSKSKKDKVSPEGQSYEKSPRSGNRRIEYLRRYREWLWPYRYGLILVIGLGFLVIFINLLQPLVSRYIIDGIILNELLGTKEKTRVLLLFGGLMLLFLILSFFIEVFRSYRLQILNAKFIFKLRRNFFRHLINLPLHELSRLKVGGITSRLTNDINSASTLVEHGILIPTIEGIRVIITVLIIVLINWRLAIVAALVLPPMLFISLLNVRRLRPVFKEMHKDSAEVNGLATEIFQGIRVVRAYSREKKEELNYARGNLTVTRKDLYAKLRQLTIDVGWGMLITTSSLIIICCGGYFVIHGQATIGDILAITLYTAFTLRPIFNIVSSQSQLQQGLAAIDRIFELFDIEVDKPDYSDAIAAPIEVKELRFANVNFGYSLEKPVITDLNLEIKGGSTVALVGKSGAGKTTLSNLVARFYDPSSGEIYLNGVDLKKIKLRSYRNMIGLVQQDTFLFDGTLRENISYANPDATDLEIADASRSANAHEFINEMPQGYDTIIGEHGFKLSGGQRQRISIARAYLANPIILIFDEATSSLDTETEQLVQAALKNLLATRTTFVIAHRLSTITSADLILVMDEGQIAESGTHEDLLNVKGIYYEMINRQQNLLNFQ